VNRKYIYILLVAIFAVIGLIFYLDYREKEAFINLYKEITGEDISPLILLFPFPSPSPELIDKIDDTKNQWKDAFISLRLNSTIKFLEKNGINVTKEDIEDGVNQLYDKVKDGQNSGPDYYLYAPSEKCSEFLEKECNTTSYYNYQLEKCQNINNSCIVDTAINSLVSPALDISLLESIQGITEYKKSDKSISNSISDTLLVASIMTTKGVQSTALVGFLNKEVHNCTNISIASETEIRACIKQTFEKFGNLSDSVYLTTEYREPWEFPDCAHTIVPSKIEHLSPELWEKMNTTKHPVLLYIRALDYYITTKCTDEILENITSTKCVEPVNYNKFSSVNYMMESYRYIPSCWKSKLSQKPLYPINVLYPVNV
jgi:hypothetical protein